MLDYALQNVEAIETDMNRFSNAHKQRLRSLRASGGVHKRKSLTEATTIKCHVYIAPSKVEFSDV